MKEEIIKQNNAIKERIVFMRKGMEISPAMELVILKEAELAFKSGAEYFLDAWKESAKTKEQRDFVYSKIDPTTKSSGDK